MKLKTRPLMESSLPLPNPPSKIIPIKYAAQLLSVTIPTLLEWNEFNILKPTITQTGEVGYREEQISQFLAIKQRSQGVQESPINTPPSTPASASINQTETFSPILTVSQPPMASLFLAFFLSFVTTVFSLMFILNFLPNSATDKKATLASPISKSSISESTTPFSPIHLQPQANPNRPMSNENVSGPENGLAALTEFPDNPSGNVAGAQTTNTISHLDFDSNSNSIGIGAYAETVNFASAKDTSDSVFDHDGNIKGNAPNTGMLAAAIFTNPIGQSSSLANQTFGLNLLLVVLALGLLTTPFILKKQPAYLTPPVMPGLLVSNPHSLEQKVLEVNQKTDGTVILHFQGQEYKVCKPELDSESDQFIERLMKLVTPGVKEIDYDALKDEEIKLSTPLSKIVTRLGFVGIKRDLFFPRTSKNRVLFRPYITSTDLASMNLSPSQISREFLSSN